MNSKNSLLDQKMNQKTVAAKRNKKNMTTVSLRIGFVGVESSAFALAAQPNTSAVAVIFSAVEQLRRHFERHSRSADVISHQWVGFFHELAAANGKDAEEEGIDNSNLPPGHKPRAAKNRQHARTLSQRQIYAIPVDEEEQHHESQLPAIGGSSIVSGNVGSVFGGNNATQQEHDGHTNSSSPFFWLDLVSPPCRVHLAVILPSSSTKVSSSSSFAVSLASSSYSEIVDAPMLPTWRIEKILRRVAERAQIHPHNLKCYAMYPENALTTTTNDDESQQQQQQQQQGVLTVERFPVSRQSPLLHLVRRSREVHLRVIVAKAPICSVRVVDRRVAQHATRVMNARMEMEQQQQHGGGGSYDDHPSYAIAADSSSSSAFLTNE